MTTTGRRLPVAIAVFALTFGAIIVGVAMPKAFAAGGATPSSGSVGPKDGSSAKWTFDPVSGADTGGMAAAVCAPGQCSKYALTVKLPQPAKVFYLTHIATLTFHCSWDSPVPDDVDCLAFSPAGSETGPGRPDTQDSGKNFEDITINNPDAGTWSLRADGAVTAQPTSVKGIATLTFSRAPRPGVQAARVSDARFDNYDFSPSYQTRDAGQRRNAGEPSLGINWKTGAAMYMAGTQITRITYSHGRPPKAHTTDVTPTDSKINEDPILFTDRQTHRTWVVGLLGAGSYVDFTDDDGKTYTASVAVSAPAFPDHETLGAGPYHKPAPAHSYPHAVYYCAQAEVEAYCGRSDDGGLTFSPLANALWNGSCTAIHGHVRVGPTGIVYVPNSSCTDANGDPRSGVAVSVDNGQTFTVAMPPDSSPGTSDPSVMEGPDGIVYFGYQAASGHPMIATATHDAKGHLHWRKSIDVGQVKMPGTTEDGLKYGVQNTEFAEVITGSKGRAAYAFLGTGKQGPYQDGSFKGTWYLFVSYTFDGGHHWRTYNATPNDPVQRGCVWNGGLVNACRNMLDFNDINIDKEGRVYVAYTDGCTTSRTYSCDKTKAIHGWSDVTSGDDPTKCAVTVGASPESTKTCTFGRLSAIVRQVCGRGLIARFDPGFNDSPECPAGSGPPTSGSVTPPLATTGSTVPWQLPLVFVLATGAVIALRRRLVRRITH